MTKISCLQHLFLFFNAVVSIIPIIIAVAFFTLAERKLMAYLQRRIGPNVVGPYGLLQPIADALKLLFKESLFTKTSTPYMYTLASVLPFIFGFINWFNVPSNELTDLSNSSSLNILYIFPISLGSVAGVVLAGWASGSKYSTLGSYRGLSQLISYDIPMIFSIIPVLFFSGSLDFVDVVINQHNNLWFVFGGFISFIIFGIAVLAETNRVPFDLPEAEAELVAGFNVEYSSINFALFFLGEYSSMLLLSLVTVCIFFGGWADTNIYIIIASIISTLIYYYALDFIIFNIKKGVKIFSTKLQEYTSMLFKLGILIEPVADEAFILLESILLTSILTMIGLIYLYLMFLFMDGFFYIFKYLFVYIYYIPFSYKVVFFGLLFILVRANVPRYRFDQLLAISWKNLIPLSLSNTLSSFFILLGFNGFITIF